MGMWELGELVLMGIRELVALFVSVGKELGELVS
jgi:hypothetical protein